ncbi:SDR family oxidoreductase [Actinoplanes sp. CA-142083]|uniref:SDR family oxidoreductase n=1 Tax=Actinoplanes sp. CA-142083 TaxID=3239903 RepID=UPI003D919E00
MFLVTGGTGTLGRHVIPLLREAGAEVRILTRQTLPGHVTGDLETGLGLDEALDGVDTVLHLAGSPKNDDQKAAHLVRAAGRARKPHIVYVSVVGCEWIPVHSAIDRGMFGYFERKRAAEVVIEKSGLPWTTLRATQFHDLTWKVAESAAKLPVMPALAGVRFQPVETAEVARHLVGLALGGPAGVRPDLAGPRVYPMTELFRMWLHATGRRRAVLPVRAAGGAYKAVRDGAVLPGPDADLGTVTWEDFLKIRA